MTVGSCDGIDNGVIELTKTVALESWKLGSPIASSLAGGVASDRSRSVRSASTLPRVILQKYSR